MSFRGTNRGRTSTVRPAQIFKKRNVLYDANVAAGITAALLGQITMTETGTIYSIKISAQGRHVSGTSGDQDVINLWVRCIPQGTGLPDLSDGLDLDTLNGFYVGRLNMANGSNSGFGTGLVEKFRFRRKCDQNSIIQLLGQSDNVNPTARVVEVVGVIAAVIRVR